MICTGSYLGTVYHTWARISGTVALNHKFNFNRNFFIQSKVKLDIREVYWKLLQKIGNHNELRGHGD